VSRIRSQRRRSQSSARSCKVQCRRCSASSNEWRWRTKAATRKVAASGRSQGPLFGTHRKLRWICLRQGPEYDRVLFLGGDVIPLCNMEYLFHSSADGILSDTYAIQAPHAPATTSIFMVTPRAGEYRGIVNLVHQHRARETNPSIFNETLGWGRVIGNREKWETGIGREPGNRWNFDGANSDQGLFWHWLKYEKLTFSLSKEGIVKTWSQITNNITVWITKADVYTVTGGKFVANTNRRSWDSTLTCGGPRLGRGKHALQPPHSDFLQLGGWQQPWYIPIAAPDVPKHSSDVRFSRDFWMYWLGQANRTLALNLPSAIIVPREALTVGGMLAQALLNADKILPVVS
jgi:hypothetical protein